MKCSATTKKGKACRAAALKDRDVCLAHSDAETRRKTQFLPGGNGKGGRPPKPRVIDVLRERIEEEIEDVVGVYREAARATKIEDGREVPDHAVRLRAVEALNDRAYGKPKQVSEISGPEGGPVEHAHIPTEDEFQQNVAKILAEADAA
jgi:hypothetical protein